MDDTKTKMELIQQLAEICAQIGWDVAIPTQDDTIPGLIIGTPEFIDELAPIITQVAGSEDYEVFSTNAEDELIEITDVVKAKKHESYH